MTARYIRMQKFVEETGYTPEQVDKWIYTGRWRQGRDYFVDADEGHMLVVFTDAHRARKTSPPTIRRRMPPWANPDAIEAAYQQARNMTLATGISHHVDHVIPLQGRYVSGLHVETNLQVVTRLENLRKGNRFEPSP